MSTTAGSATNATTDPAVISAALEAEKARTKELTAHLAAAGAKINGMTDTTVRLQQLLRRDKHDLTLLTQQHRELTQAEEAQQTLLSAMTDQIQNELEPTLTRMKHQVETLQQDLEEEKGSSSRLSNRSSKTIYMLKQENHKLTQANAEQQTRLTELTDQFKDEFEPALTGMKHHIQVLQTTKSTLSNDNQELLVRLRTHETANQALTQGNRTLAKELEAEKVAHANANMEIDRLKRELHAATAAAVKKPEGEADEKEEEESTSFFSGGLFGMFKRRRV